MELFYSIRELARIIGKDIYKTASILKAAGITPTYQGKPANLNGWTGGIFQRGNNITVIKDYVDLPDPSEVLILTEHLSPSWLKEIQLYEAGSIELLTEPSNLYGLLERHEPATNGAASNVERGVTKAEILDAEWPIPAGAPSLESILNKIPKWVEAACIKVGRPGKGRSGSHLWNPAMLAVCLATRTPHKNWTCKQKALTDLIRCSFSDYLEEWTEKQEML